MSRLVSNTGGAHRFCVDWLPVSDRNRTSSRPHPARQIKQRADILLDCHLPHCLFMTRFASSLVSALTLVLALFS